MGGAGNGPKKRSPQPRGGRAPIHEPHIHLFKREKPPTLYGDSITYHTYCTVGIAVSRGNRKEFFSGSYDIADPTTGTKSHDLTFFELIHTVPGPRTSTFL